MYENRGVKLTMRNGRVVLLGSQKSYLLYDAILRKDQCGLKTKLFHHKK